MMESPIPWPPVPGCWCGSGPLRVMVRDRVGAEMKRDVCHRPVVVWFTQAEIDAIDQHRTANSVDG
jgi:hypothetical protein